MIFMKTTLKIINIGRNSKGVIIPKHIIVKLNLKKGELIEIDIKKINDG